MKLKQLGSSGLMVSEICLGSMTFGGQMPAWDARQVMDKFVQQHGNFIDTAGGYNNGKAEEVIGQWMVDGHHRPHMIIGTKAYFPEDGDPNHRRLSRHAILYAVEQSLRRLQTDYIDIFYPQYWDAGTPLDETLYALEQLIQQGKIRYVGCSNYTSWQLMKALTIQRQNHWSPFIVLQAQYSLIERGIEREITGLLESEGVGLLPWSPLAGGFLTGKYQRGAEFDEKHRLGQPEGYLPAFYRDLSLNERGWRILDAVRDIAELRGVSPEQVALAWLLQNPLVTSVIIGVSVIEHIDTNLAVDAVRLSGDELAHLDGVSAIDLGYPGYMPHLINAFSEPGRD